MPHYHWCWTHANCSKSVQFSLLLCFDGIFFMNLMHRTVLTLFHKTCLAYANSDRMLCLLWACSADSRTVLAILGNYTPDSSFSCTYCGGCIIVSSAVLPPTCLDSGSLSRFFFSEVWMWMDEARFWVEFKHVNGFCCRTHSFSGWSYRKFEAFVMQQILHKQESNCLSLWKFCEPQISPKKGFGCLHLCTWQPAQLKVPIHVKRDRALKSTKLNRKRLLEKRALMFYGMVKPVHYIG
jgi:hypothetical protein